MKKFIASIAALTVCTFMFTACGSSGTTGEDRNITDQNAEASNDAAASYASIEEFISDSEIFNIPGDPVVAESSYTIAFINSLKDGNDLYMEMRNPVENSTTTMAITENRVFMSTSSDDENFSFIVTDGKMYVFEPSSEKGFYMELSEKQFAEILSSFNSKMTLSDMRAYTDIDLDGLMSRKANIAGEIYTFESTDSSGILYYPDGKICSFVYGNASPDSMPVIYNEMSAHIPDNIFDIPSDHEFVEISTDLAGLFGISE